MLQRTVLDYMAGCCPNHLVRSAQHRTNMKYFIFNEFYKHVSVTSKSSQLVFPQLDNLSQMRICKCNKNKRSDYFIILISTIEI